MICQKQAACALNKYHIPHSNTYDIDAVYKGMKNESYVAAINNKFFIVE